MSGAKNEQPGNPEQPGIAGTTTPPPSGDENLLERIFGFLRFSIVSYVATLVVFIIPFALLVYTADYISLGGKIWGTAIYLLAISVLYFLALVFERGASHLLRRRTIEGDIRQLYEQLGEGDFFTTLIRINFKYIDKYYLQTQLQANKSYYLASAAAVVSLLLILTGIMMLFFSTEPNKINASYVTMSAGVLGEFIATVFFVLYNRMDR